MERRRQRGLARVTGDASNTFHWAWNTLRKRLDRVDPVTWKALGALFRFYDRFEKEEGAR